MHAVLHSSSMYRHWLCLGLTALCFAAIRGRAELSRLNLLPSACKRDANQARHFGTLILVRVNG